MKHCINCGEALASGAKFCSNCGNSLTKRKYRISAKEREIRSERMKKLRGQQ